MPCSLFYCFPIFIHLGEIVAFLLGRTGTTLVGWYRDSCYSFNDDNATGLWIYVYGIHILLPVPIDRWLCYLLRSSSHLVASAVHKIESVLRDSGGGARAWAHWIVAMMRFSNNADWVVSSYLFSFFVSPSSVLKVGVGGLSRMLYLECMAGWWWYLAAEILKFLHLSTLLTRND